MIQKEISCVIYSTPPHNNRGSLKNEKTASRVAKSLVFLAVASALSSTAFASPRGDDTRNLTKYPSGTNIVLENFDQTYTAGKKDDKITAQEKEGVVGILVGSNDYTKKASASAENFSASLTLNRENVPASAYTLLLNNAPATFTGSSTKLSMTTTDGLAQVEEDPDHAGSALLVHGPRSTSQASDTTLVSFEADTTTLGATLKGAKAASTNVLHLEGNSAVAFSGKTVNITALTESDSSGAFEHHEASPAAGIGIMLEAYSGADSAKTADTANIRTGKDTTLNISVTGTGTTTPNSDEYSYFREGGASFLSGIFAEGGEIYAQGDVNINVNAKGGTAIGTVLYARALDHSDLSQLNGKNWEFTDFGKTVSYDQTSTFEKSLTLNVHSDTGHAAGMILAGSCCNLEGINDKWEDEGGYADTRNPNATTKVTVNDLTLNVTKGDANKFASDGVLLVGTRVGGTTELNINGNATITADNALRSAYWVSDGVEGQGDVQAKVMVGEKASLTLNGNVSGYAGDFIQNGGTVTVNTKDGKFFGGAVQVLGGKLTAENSDWTVAANSVLNGDVTLGNVTVNSGNDLQMTGGKLAAKSFSLLGGKIEGNADLTLFGGDADESILDGATLKVKNLTLDGKNGKGLDDGALIDVHEGSKLIVTGDMTLTDKTVLSGSASTVHAQNLILENGSWYYDQDLNETREFQVSDGALTLRGGQLITSVDGKETESADKAARIESLLLKKTSDAVFSRPVAAYIEAGTYDFKKGITLADNDAEMCVKGDNTVVNVGTLAVNGGSFMIGADGDKPLVTVKTITIADGAKMELVNGTLSTTTDQIFTNGLGADGTVTDAGSQIYAGSQYDKLALTGGTLAFSDAFYNDLYKKSAENTLNDKSKTTLVFNGQRVDAKGSVDIGDIEDNDKTVESNVTVKVDADETGKAEIDKSFGVSRIELSETVKDIVIKAKDTAKKIIKLVGSGSKDGELISGSKLENIAVGEKATLQLGETGSIHNQGQISAALTVGESGTLAVKTGDFKLADVTAKKGMINIDAGNVTFNKLTADEGAINISDGASVAVSSLTLQGDSQIAAGTNMAVTKLVLDKTADAAHEITGAMTIDELAVNGDKNVTLNIGTEGENGTRGDLTLKGDSLAGLSFFLDPAYVDGQTIADGSRLMFAGDTVDGKVAVGQNSYVVLGGTDDSNLTAAFNSGKVTWGNADGAVLAAAYVAKPITIDSSTGGLLVNGTLTSSQNVTAGSVTFKANSALVADVTNVTDSTTALITADSVSVAEGSKAVLVGTLRQGVNYMLTSNAAANLNWAGNLVAGNALWKLTMNDDGTISTRLTDASVIFGSSMQGTALANAGMETDNEYVNKLLTDESGNIANLGNTAARFDAAMNAAGALTTFTTAYDRASDLRQIVREEAVKGEGNRVWARVTGGKTKLKGISTGGADLHTKTNAYGLVIGGEAELSSVTLGAAFTAGTGDTKNSAVSGKDDFDFYGLSVYGTTTLGSVDVLADASVNVLKSDLTVGGVADVDTDVTTSVYSFGVQGQKTFALDVADITPFIGANIYHVRGGSYSNGHGAHVASSNATAVEFPIGAKVSKDFETAAGMKVAPAFSLAVVPTVGNRDIDSKVKFAGAQSTYNYTFTDDVKVRTKLGVDATSGNFNFGLQAGYEWGNEERSSASVEARLKYMF